MLNSSDTDLNNYTASGIWSFDKLSSAMSHAPNTGQYFSGTLFVAYYSNAKILQVFISDSGNVFIRYRWNSSTTWSDWVAQPTRTEVDVLKSNIRYTATLNTEYFESGVVYVYRCGNMLTVTGSDLKVKKAITGTNVVIATDSHLVTATGQNPFFPVIDYTQKTVYRGRVVDGAVAIPYDGGAAVNDTLYFTATFAVGSTVAS